MSKLKYPQLEAGDWIRSGVFIEDGLTKDKEYQVIGVEFTNTQGDCVKIIDDTGTIGCYGNNNFTLCRKHPSRDIKCKVVDAIKLILKWNKEYAEHLSHGTPDLPVIINSNEDMVTGMEIEDFKKQFYSNPIEGQIKDINQRIEDLVLQRSCLEKLVK